MPSRCGRNLARCSEPPRVSGRRANPPGADATWLAVASRPASAGGGLALLFASDDSRIINSVMRSAPTFLALTRFRGQRVAFPEPLCC